MTRREGPGRTRSTMAGECRAERDAPSMAGRESLDMRCPTCGQIAWLRSGIVVLGDDVHALVAYPGVTTDLDRWMCECGEPGPDDTDPVGLALARLPQPWLAVKDLPPFSRGQRASGGREGRQVVRLGHEMARWRRS